jgi:tRNA (guanine-N7-)-methyltransferase
MIRRNPDYGFIGAEPFVNGMTAFLKEIDNEGTTENVRLHMDDAIPLVKSLTPNSIDEIYVLNPDPWHKVRHHQRRIINQGNLDLFSNILKTNGRLIMSTDVKDLIEWMVTEASTHPDFEWEATKADDWRIPPKDWIPTRYETKGAKGADKMNYLFFRKR